MDTPLDLCVVVPAAGGHDSDSDQQDQQGAREGYGNNRSHTQSYRTGRDTSCVYNYGRRDA